MTWTAGRIDPVTLSGNGVRLEPLAQAHHDDLAEATADGELHRLWFTVVPDAAGMRAEIDRRLALQEAGSMLPFAVVDDASGRAVGMTTYMNVDGANRRVEVGSTWYRASAQGTGVNVAAKLLLLGHAFEDLGCIAVEFRTHWMNHASRRAIEGIGAKLDGVLRNHQVMPNGTLRDTCVYSVVAAEWPTVRALLELKASRPRRSVPGPVTA